MNVDMQNEPNQNAGDELKSSQEKDIENGSEATSEIQKLEEELLDYKDRYMRQAADMENMRRRNEKDRSDLLKYGTERLLSEMLPVLDSLDKAILSCVDDKGPLAEGVRMVQKQFLTVLENQGLKAIEAKGQNFDPNLHQAIQRIEDDVAAEVVRDEYQKGYTLNGRLVRPSMVSVAVPKT